MNSSHYVYIYGDSLGRASGLDEIEDEIDERTRNYADVTGSGSGESGWNIDVEITNNDQRGLVLSEIAKVLHAFELPWSTILDIDGIRIDLRAIYRETVLHRESPESNRKQDD